MDASLGAILDNLSASKVLDKTIIVFLSDNGGLSNHTRATTGDPYVLDGHNRPIRSGKGAAYEGGTRTPMIVYWPGVVKAGSRSDLPTITVDMLPTLLSMAGVPKEDRPPGPLDGVDLTPALRGLTAGDAERPLFWHYPHQWYRDIGVGDGIEPHTSVRRGRWKLYYFYSDRRWELYDLKTDLGEAHNVLDDHRAEARALATLLVDWMKDVDAQLPVEKASGKPVPMPVAPAD
jgi:arylsulfatase A-like enzyme